MLKINLHRNEGGLCFYWDEAYQPGHKCKGKQLHLLIGGEEDEDVEMEVRGYHDD